MRIAVPAQDSRLCVHFGHCETFAIIDVDEIKKCIVKREDILAPTHQPGLLPPWLKEKGVDMVIAGGMGQRALGLFQQQGVRVLVGAPSLAPEDVVLGYFQGNLELGQNVCDH